MVDLKHSSDGTSNSEENTTSVAGEVGSAVVGVGGGGSGLGGSASRVLGISSSGGLGGGAGREPCLLGGGLGAVEGGVLAVDLDLARGVAGARVVGAVVVAAARGVC
jgi:hypothetical protein